MQPQQQYYPQQQQQFYPPQQQYTPPPSYPQQQYAQPQPYPQQQQYPPQQQYPQTRSVDPSQPTGYPAQPMNPYPSQPMNPYPAQPMNPYPSQPMNPYPSQPMNPYPTQPMNPYPAQPMNPYPVQPMNPYPSPYQYYVFNPTNFSDTNNPWTASMWLQNYNPPPPGQPPQTTEIFKFQSVEEFQKLRQHASIESALKQLNELAVDLSRIDPHTFNPEPACCFICCNTYVTPKYKLGVGPLNDAITVAANHTYMGYKVYYLHNPHHSLFLKFLKRFLQKVDQYLTIFYTGHGAQIKDTSGDEADGYDEVIVFDSGYVVDDDLAKYLNKYSKGIAHTILLSDCCHSGTIWDIPETLREAQKFPANIMSISASNDSQTAKQLKIQQSNQGIFTFNFWTLLRNNPSIRIEEVKRILNPQLKKFNQNLEMYPTRREMLDKPVFPLMIKNH